MNSEMLEMITYRSKLAPCRHIVVRDGLKHVDGAVFDVDLESASEPMNILKKVLDRMCTTWYEIHRTKIAYELNGKQITWRYVKK